MSRPPPPGQVYGYPAAHHLPQAPQNYYYDDTEDYVGDYSESDGLSDGPHLVQGHPPNVTEIYRRKPTVQTSSPPPPSAPAPPQPPQAHEHYRHNVYVPPNYYYEPIPTPVSHPMPRPAVPHHYRRIPVVDNRTRYYSPGPLEDAYGDGTVIYATPAQTATVRRPLQVQAQPMPPISAPQAVRRHPVTVRTPRYYRRSPSSNLYKRPSTLCLPLACQPDPAVYRRTRKITEDPTYHHHSHQSPPPPNQVIYTQQAQHYTKNLERRHSVPIPMNITTEPPPTKTRKPQCPADMHMTQSDVDAVLARYETIFGNQIVEATVKSTDSGSNDKCEKKQSKTKVGSSLKPRAPSTVKQKKKPEEKCKPVVKEDAKKRNVSASGKVEHLEVEEITTEVLDSMLSELLESGCENKIAENQQKTMERGTSPARSLYEEHNSNCAPSKPFEYSMKNPGASNTDLMKAKTPFHQSFNYQDISQNMSKSQQELLLNSHQDAFSKQQQLENFTKRQQDLFSKSQQDGYLRTSSPSSPRSPRFELSNAGFSNVSRRYDPPSNYSRTVMDDNSASELHRSKSYIVNLIDRALSKELGTIVEEKPSNVAKEFEQSNTRQTPELMDKHFGKSDKGFGMDFNQSLMDPCVSNAVTTAHQCEPKRETSCPCGIQDEPLYVRQLKQLRWGHLKHIQREVRRLEDLERFLDSCSSQSYM